MPYHCVFFPRSKKNFAMLPYAVLMHGIVVMNTLNFSHFSVLDPHTLPLHSFTTQLRRCLDTGSLLLVFWHWQRSVHNIAFHLHFGPNWPALQRGLCAIAQLLVLEYCRYTLCFPVDLALCLCRASGAVSWANNNAVLQRKDCCVQHQYACTISYKLKQHINQNYDLSKREMILQQYVGKILYNG